MKTKITFFIFFLVLFNYSFLVLYSFAQWEPDVRLTNATGISQTSLNNAWCIAANGNEVHVVWYDARDGNQEIYYKRSSNGGLNWGADTRLTNNSDISTSPSIAITGSNMHVVWCDYRDGNPEIYYKRSTDGGLNWGADTRLTNNNEWSFSPCIAVSGSIVHVVWEDTRYSNYEIYYKRSTDGGTNWGIDTRLTNKTANSFNPSIAVTSSNVHIVWSDERDVNSEIYYKRSTDDGLNWGADTRLTNNTSYSESSCISVSGPNVHVVWRDFRDGNYEIYYKRSSDGGTNWGTDTRLTNNSAISSHPSIATFGSNVHVVWEDERDYGNYIYEIYYKRSTDGGFNWEVDTRLTNISANSESPTIAISGSIVNVVWTDERNVNDEIYYKRNPTGNVGIKNISTEIPSAFSLEQNYPNPFNSMTIVKFKILNEVNAEIKVFDMLGKVVATLVNEKMKPGIYETTFNAGNLPSGIYFYRLQTESYIETKQMILEK